jgi:flagellar biosynthesis/type III secretory pathway M-ring protein FliF/YscJ
MEFLRQRLVQVKASWDQLSTSGRLALALTVALVVALLVIVAHNAGSTDLVVLPTQFKADELPAALSALESQGIRAEARGGQIVVPGDKQSAALAMLAFSDTMPQSGIDYEKLLGDSGMWTSKDQRDRRWHLFLKQEFERQIAQFPGVRRVGVNITFGSDRTLRSVPEGTSASIVVQTRRPLDKPLALAMARVVTGAVSGLSVENVHVVDQGTGRSFDLSGDSQVYSDDYVRTVQAYKAHFRKCLLDQFADIRGLKVNVNVVPDLDRETTQTHVPDATKTIEGSIKSRESTTSAGSAASEVGVMPNAGAGVAGGSEAAANSDSDEEIGHAVDWGKTDSVLQKTPGAVKEITAAISVPRSYLVKIAELRTGAAGDSGGEGAEEPPAVDDAAIQAVFDAEKPKITRQAAKVIGAEDESAVDVVWHYDFEPPEAALADAGGPGAMGMIENYGPSVGLGLFAVLALLMVYSVVRKIQPAALPTEGATAAEPVSEAGLTLDSILEGVELEADVIRASKMQEQISNMIKEDPDGVTTLVKRWIAQE